MLALLVAGTLPTGCALLSQADTLRARARAFEPAQLGWTFQHMAELFPTRTVSRGGAIHALPREPKRLEELRFSVDGREVAFGDFLRHSATAGLVVLQGGRLVYERYAPGSGPATRFTSWSVAKSFVSTLVGIALGEGHIASLDDPLERYLPEASASAYSGVTIRQALQMSSGVSFSEVYEDGGSDVLRLIRDSMVLHRVRANARAISFRRAAEPGTVFNYNTAETQVLAWLVQRATGQSPSAYLEAKLWRPLGMEHDAAWVLDREGPDGMEMGGCCLNAALRDWARFGQLFLQDGVWEGQTLLPEGWVGEATLPGAPHLAYGKVEPGSEAGYGYQWWPFADGTFAAEGVYGQLIWVDPAHQVVIAKASVWPSAWDDALEREVFAAFRAIALHVAPAP